MYQVQVAIDKEFQNLVVNKVVADVTDYTLTQDLEHFTVYWWRVKAIDEYNGNESLWSIPCAFRVKAQDVIINHDIGSPMGNSYILFYPLVHEFIRSTDTECVTPTAKIGIGMCNVSATAQVGVVGGCNGSLYNYCPGVCLPKWDGFDVEYIFTEDDYMIETEDGFYLVLEP
jgi:hypothetical protein